MLRLVRGFRIVLVAVLAVIALGVVVQWQLGRAQSSSPAATGESRPHGATAWNVVQVFSGFEALGPLDCPERGECLRSDGFSVVRVSEEGRNWARATEPATMLGDPVGLIDCPSASSCFATVSGSSPGELLASTDGGRSWHAQRLPSATSLVVASLSCASASWCMAVGYSDSASGILLPASFVTANGGRAWRAARFPLQPGNSLSDVSCPAPGQCWVGEESVASPGAGIGIGGVARLFLTRDGGSSWQPVSVALSSVSAAAAASGVVSALSGLRCVTLKTCWIVGLVGSTNALLRTTDAGDTWRELHEPPAVTGLAPAGPSLPDCVDASHCYVTIGAELASSNDGGARWREYPLPRPAASGRGEVASSTTATALSCNNVASCVVGIDESGAPNLVLLASTADGGRHWVVGAASRNLEPAAVTCPSGAANCVIVDSQSDFPPLLTLATGARGVEESVLPGAWDPASTWQGPLRPTPPCSSWVCTAVQSPVGAATCSGATCVVLATTSTTSYRPAAIVSSNGGRRWSDVALPLIGPLVDMRVACVSSEDCLVFGVSSSGPTGKPRIGQLGQTIVMTTNDGGRHWRSTGASLPLGSPVTPKALAGMVLTCWQASGCLLAQAVSTGTGFASASVISGTGLALSVSRDGGRHWHTSVLRTGLLLPLGASCAPRGACTVWARSPTYSDLVPGQLLMSSGVGGSNWREHELPRWLRLYETPTCSSSAWCFAAGWDAGEPGVALTVDGGTRWSFESAPASWRAVSADGWRIASMSCSTTTNCIAVAVGTSTGDLAVLRFSDVASSDR